VEFTNQQEVLVFERYSILLRQAVMAARAEAGKLGSDVIDSEHLLMGIFCVHPDIRSTSHNRIRQWISHFRVHAASWLRPGETLVGHGALPIPDEHRFGRRSVPTHLYE